MKILVVSDVHGDFKTLQDIYLKNQDSDYFFLLGDYELPEYLLNPFTFVKGNCDFLSDAPLTRDIILPQGNVHLEHGNNIDFNNFDAYVTKTNSFLFLFGHTHVKFFKKINNTYVFNPGSTSYPRDGEYGSYLIIEIDKNNNLKHHFVLIKDK